MPQKEHIMEEAAHAETQHCKAHALEFDLIRSPHWSLQKGHETALSDFLNKKEIVPDNGHLTNFSVPVKSWLLEENLQPLPDYTSIILTTI